MLIVIKIIYFSPYCWMANHRVLYFRLIIWSNLPTQKEVVARFYHFHFCHPHGLVLIAVIFDKYVAYPDDDGNCCRNCCYLCMTSWSTNHYLPQSNLIITFLLII